MTKKPVDEELMLDLEAIEARANAALEAAKKKLPHGLASLTARRLDDSFALAGEDVPKLVAECRRLRAADDERLKYQHELYVRNGEVSRLKARLEKAEAVCEAYESLEGYWREFPGTKDDAPGEYVGPAIEAWRAGRGGQAVSRNCCHYCGAHYSDGCNRTCEELDDLSGALERERDRVHYWRKKAARYRYKDMVAARLASDSLKRLAAESMGIRIANEKLKARAEKAKDIVDTAREWVRAHHLTGPDNGPSLTEQDCANLMAVYLAAYDGALNKSDSGEGR